MNNHIVYAAFDGDVCLYVGEGKPYRYLHLTSGVSHVYEANAWHFMGKKIEVKVLEENLSKQQSREKEKEYIEKLNPCWNKRDFLVIRKDRVNQYVNKEITKVFKGINSTIGAKQKKFCKYVSQFMAENGQTLLAKGQAERATGLPAGFVSRCCDQKVNYYPCIRKIFKIERLDNGYYSVQFRNEGWVNG